MILPISISLIYIALGFPMALKMISPNYLYGVRVQSTLKNKDIWFYVNAVTGWSFVIYGVFLLILTFISLSLAEHLFIMAILPTIIFVLTAYFSLKKAKTIFPDNDK